MAQGIFGKNVLGARPQGLMGLGATDECNPASPSYDPEWCKQTGGTTNPIWTSKCAYSPWVYSPETAKVQQQMVNRGATQLKVDGKWGSCTEQAYQTIYGEPLSQQSLLRQGIECSSFQQADKSGWGNKPNPAECSNPLVITPKAPPQVDVPTTPPVIPETPPSCIGPGMRLDPATLQCVMDEIVCPSGQYVGQDNLCHDIKVTCPAHKVPGPNGCMDMPAPPTGPQISQMVNLKVPSIINMNTGDKVQASSAPKLSSVPLKMFNFANLSSASAPVQSSSTGFKMPTLRTVKLPGVTEPQKQKLDPVTGQWVEDTSWISGIPNWLVVVAALAAAGGGYYYYQKKHKPGTKAPGK
jgi:hypothetical protein